MEVCRAEPPDESDLMGGSWLLEAGVGGLWVTGGLTGAGAATGLGLLTEVVT